MFRRRQKDLPLDKTRAASLQREHKRSVFWSRMLAAAFFATYTIAMFYLIPWFPGGLSADDYTAMDAAVSILLLSTALFAFATMQLRERARRAEQALVGWSTVHEGLSDLRQREYFFDRVVFECSNSRTAGGEFTVIALRLDEKRPTDIDDLNRVIMALRPIIKDADCAAVTGPHEVCVLAPRVFAPAAPGFSEDLRRLAQSALGEQSVRVGWSVYGLDGAFDAGDLIGKARQAIAPPPGESPTEEDVAGESMQAA